MRKILIVTYDVGNIGEDSYVEITDVLRIMTPYYVNSVQCLEDSEARYAEYGLKWFDKEGALVQVDLYKHPRLYGEWDFEERQWEIARTDPRCVIQAVYRPD